VHAAAHISALPTDIYRIEICIGMGKARIPWDSHRNENTISHGMGMGIKTSEWECA